MGTESEFGVLAPGAPSLTPTQLSAAVTTAMVEVTERLGSRGAAAPWDYVHERPLDDARGFRRGRDEADPSQLTDEGRVLDARQIALEDGDAWESLREESPVLMNLVLGNGARFYVDHAHPEYSSPETTNSLDAVTWDAAGDRLASLAAGLAGERLGTEVLLHKNNTDGKGQSYGTHENYLVPRAVPFDALVRGLLPFFVSRPVTCGAGRVGLGRRGERPGFQLSQRADFFENTVGLETTIRRPLVNTRDEPHADDARWRRLHVIPGDANLHQVSAAIRLGSTSLVLRLVEDGLAPEVTLADPVADVARVSHDPTLRVTLVADAGRRLSALDLQELYLEAAEAAYGAETDGAETATLRLWRRAVDALRRDAAGGGDDEAARLVEWRAKLSLLRRYRERGSLPWDDPRLAMIDLQWSDLRPGRGLALALAARGELEPLVAEDAVEAARVTPPRDSRAWTRGRTVTAFPDAVVAANWDSLSLALPHRAELVRVGLANPWLGTEPATRGLFDGGVPVERLVASLRGL